MREGLTALAAALVIALLAAVILPGLMDWSSYRPSIDAALSRSFGVNLRSSGDVHLRLLPTPRLDLGNVEAGQPGQSRLSIASLNLELAPAPLLRGEIRITSARADNVTATLELDADGKILMPTAPATGNGNTATAIDQLDITRGRVLVRRHGQPDIAITPIAAQISASDLRGPWRLTGEVAGMSLRIATGVADETGLRMKISIGNATSKLDSGKLDLDGIATLAGSVPGFTGSLGLQSAADGQAFATATAKVTLTGQMVNLAAIAIDLPGQPGRIEGDAIFGLTHSTQPHLNLSAKRLDVAALRDSHGLLADMLRHAGNTIPVTITAISDQVVIQGEDMTEVRLQGSASTSGLRIDKASARFAGSDITAAGTLTSALDSGSLQLTLAIPDMRRPSLTLARMGLDAAAADFLSAQGRTCADARLDWNADGWHLSRVNGESGDGRWGGSVSSQTGRIDITATAHGISLAGLPSLASLAAGRVMSARIDIDQARLPGLPPGQFAGKFGQDAQGFTIEKLVASGFGGVQVEAAGRIFGAGTNNGTDNGNGNGTGLAGTISAPDAAPVLALLQPFIGEHMGRTLRRKIRLLSPLDLEVTVNPADRGGTVNLVGRLGAGQVKGTAVLAKDHALTSGGFAYEADSTSTLAALLGLPSPATPLGRAALSATLSGEELGLRIGAGALNVTGNGRLMLQEGKADILVTVRTPSAGALIPIPWVPMLPQGPLAFTALMRFADDRISFERMTGSSMADHDLGTLALEADGRITGALTLPALDGAALLAAAAGSAVLENTGSWSTKPFLDSANPLIGRVTFAVNQLRLGDITTGLANFTLDTTPDETRLSELNLQAAGGAIRGDVRLSRSGTLASLAARLDMTGLNLAGLTNGVLSGTLTSRLTAGGAGETAARLMNGFAGSGSIELASFQLNGVSPTALGETAILGSQDGLKQNESLNPDKLRQKLDADFKTGSWPIGNIQIPLSITGGVIRLALPDSQIGTALLTPRLAIDLRQLQIDARALVRMSQRPHGWVGDTPQANVTWIGPLRAPVRHVETGTLANAFAQRSLEREIERIEAFEADARERALFARRLRWEREQRTLEEAAERARQEQARQEQVRQEQVRLEAAKQAAPSGPMLIVPGLANPARTPPAAAQPPASAAP
jgi:uncharacterized protein involved in outer membrane biogenesis